MTHKRLNPASEGGVRRRLAERLDEPEYTHPPGKYNLRLLRLRQTYGVNGSRAVPIADSRDEIGSVSVEERAEYLAGPPWPGEKLWYDPTNGTTSWGDIVYWGSGGGFDPPDSSFHPIPN